MLRQPVRFPHYVENLKFVKYFNQVRPSIQTYIPLPMWIRDDYVEAITAEEFVNLAKLQGVIDAFMMRVKCIVYGNKQHAMTELQVRTKILQMLEDDAEFVESYESRRV
eukprot:GILJ01020985.1.p2 GENE.GILJ01020985.1~~GILJ01020985.1.p2  ORF type:complete len:109 (+),score=12.59 GILJ01020985.1:999-1325(+)